MSDIVVYHDKCIDGFTAAWACWLEWPHARYVPRNYGQSPDLGDVFRQNILLVDFSYPPAILEDLIAQGAASIVILDHHKTAEADLEPFRFQESSAGAVGRKDVDGMLRDLAELGRPPIIALFDMERSGAGMAWDFVHGGPRPRLIDLVEDRDLWRFNFKDESRDLHLALSSGEMSFARWTNASAYLPQMLKSGRSIAAYRDSLIDEIVDRAWLGEIDGQCAAIVDCPYLLARDTGHRLLDRFPEARLAALRVASGDGITYSLRSNDERADVAEIARKFGGGGHRNAAGFRAPL